MSSVKTVGRSGQISLGKEFAGRHVLVEEPEPGVWVVRLGDFVPDNERWLHEKTSRETLDRAIAWAESHPPRRTSLTRLSRRRGR